MTPLELGPPSVADRIAATLGWTAGQVWTVAIGLVLAVPAAIFGLGPALDAVTSPPPALAAPSHADTGAPAPTGAPAAEPAPAPLPSILSDAAPGSSTAPAGQAAPSPPAADDATAPAAPPAGDELAATIDGPGTVRSVAAAADATVVAVDLGPDEPGSVVVLDGAGATVATVALVVNGVSHQRATGIAVDHDGVVVATATPAAVLRVDLVSGTVEALAAIPDLPTCLPVAREADCQPGLDAAPEPAHVAVSPDGVVYVADRAQGCVFSIDGGEAAPWLCDVSFAGAPAAQGSGLRGIDATGERVVVTVRQVLDAHDTIEEIAIDGGRAGSRQRLAELDPADGVDGVAVLGDGRVAAALHGAGAVHVVSAGPGGESQRVTGFDRPVDVAARDGDVVVAHLAEGAAGAVRSRSLDRA